MNQNKNLSSITDEGLFENIVHDVLRKQNDSYAQINQTGVSKKGKPIGDPVDGITLIQNENGEIIEAIIVECTTTKRSNLISKLLRKDPAKLGDIIKAKQKFEKYKTNNPKIKCTLVVCFNESDSSDIEEKVKSYCADHGIKVDIWSYSRLNDFLENDPQGQYIRYNYFEKKPISTSEELIQEVILSNFEEYKDRFSFSSNNIRSGKDIERDLFKTLEELVYTYSGLILLKGESGYGKTTLCFQLFKNLIENKFYVLRVSPDLILESHSINEAIDKLFKSKFPELIDSPSAKISTEKLVVFIDDINRSNEPRKVLDKLQNWVNASNGKNELNYLVVCPSWNRNALIKLEQKQSSFIKELSLTQYSDSEFQNIVELNNISVDQAPLIKNEIGNDPYLLGIYLSNASEYSTNPNEIIKEYLNDELGELRSSGNTFQVEFRNAIEKLVFNQLKQKKLYPNENDLVEWSNNESLSLDLIKKIEKESALLYFEKSQSNERKLFFKHDRLHQHFIVNCIRKLIDENNIDESILFEPYYLDYIGKALVNIQPNENLIDLIFDKQPLIWFHYLKEIGILKSDFYEIIHFRTSNWLIKFVSSSNESDSRYNAIMSILQEASPYISLPLGSRLKHTHKKVSTLFKSGNPNYGIYYFANRLDNDFYSNYIVIKGTIEKIKSKYLKKAINDIRFALISKGCEPEIHRGAILFAGHIAAKELAQDIFYFFNNYDDKNEIIVECIWAMLNCCRSADLNHKMIPFLEVWESMSNKKLVYKRLGGVIREINNNFLDSFFIEIYNNNECLKNYIYPFLTKLDSVKALMIILENLSDYHKEYLKIGGVPLHLLNMGLQPWNGLESNKLKYSSKTLEEIKDLSTTHSDKHVKVFAFRLWSKFVTKDNIRQLQEIDEKSLFFNDAIKRRFWLGDRTVMNHIYPELKRTRFLNANFIWCNELFLKILNTLKSLSKENLWPNRYLLSIPELHAEKLIEQYYSILGNDKKLFQYCIYIGTDKLQSIADSIFHQTINKNELFENISNPISLKNRESNAKKIDKLFPYFKDIPDEEISRLILFFKDHFSNRFKENLLKILKENNKENLLSEIVCNKEDLLNGFFECCKCECGEYCNLDFWLYNKIDSKGYSNSEFIDILSQFLIENNSIQKYKDVGAALKRIGKRSDLKTLEENIIKEKLDECEKIIDDVKFGIEYRTLA